MVDWVGSDSLPWADVPATMQPAQKTGEPLRVNIPGRATTAPASALPPEAGVLYDRIRRAESTAAGDGYVFYGGQPFKPGKDFPAWDGAKGPQGTTHAAGPGQWEPDTWNGLKPEFEHRFGRTPDFSSDSDQKAMSWLNAAKVYPGGADKLRRDIAAGKLDTSKLAGQWAGFGRAPSPWAVTQSGNWRVADRAIAYEQGRKDTSVVWMSPDDYLGMIPEEGPNASKRKSLLASVKAGDEIEAIPTLDVRAKDGRAEVIDQDGRNRAMLAKENGVGLIPVAVHGLTGPVGWITDMRGQVRPFDFAAVPKVDKLAASRFPYDMPGVTYGNILPVARDTDTGKITLAAPEFIRSMARGMLDTGAQIVGDKPFQPQETPDQLSAASLGAGGPLVRSAEPAVNAAGQAVAGGAVRGANVLAEAMVPQSPEVGNFLRTLQGMTKNDNAAIDAINRRFAQDRAAGGPGIEEIGNQFAAARREGQPIVLADVAGENVRGLLGNVAREPGPARNRVKQFAVNRLGDIDRNSPIAASLEGGIERYLATGSARTEARALAEQRAAAAPLWEKAMSGGSIAPLGTFFEREFSDAGRIVAEANANIARLRQELTGLKARQSQAGNVYSTSGANRAVQFVQDKIADQEKKIAAADGYKTAVLEKLRQAQADQTANAPGAVWSPYLGRLLSNPRVKSGGLARGYRIERDLADAEGRQLNPREYAIVGEDANGDPIVGAVPNMKLLAVAKEGLDATLDTPAMRDELTGRLNKEGRAVKMLRDGLVNELDRLNPAYKTARDKWAGDSALIVAIRAGKEFHKTSPEEIAEWFGHASESEKEFYRLGAADTMRDDLQRKVFGADPSKAIINSPRMREQLRPMFRSDEDANRFLDRVRRARQMFQTPVDILGNSKTAAREAEDLARRHGLDTAADVLSGVAHAAAGHPIGIMRSGLNLARNYLSGPNLAVNDAVARLLLDPTIHVSPGENLLRSIPLPRTRNALAEGMRRGVQGFGQNRLLSGQ